MISAVKIVALVQTLALSANGIRIVQSNDDGWAEQNIRTLNDALIASGHQVLLSGPAQDNSGTGMLWWPLAQHHSPASLDPSL